MFISLSYVTTVLLNHLLFPFDRVSMLSVEYASGQKGIIMVSSIMGNSKVNSSAESHADLPEGSENSKGRASFCLALLISV